MFNSYRLLPVHGIEPREGAELSERESVRQRSTQGAHAPQRTAGPAARDPPTLHHLKSRPQPRGCCFFVASARDRTP